jgi:putative nucleotidyltransferase with HDIG domain
LNLEPWLPIGVTRRRHPAHLAGGKRDAESMITANWTEWVSSHAWCSEDVNLAPAAPRALNEVFWLMGEEDVDTRRLITIVTQDPEFTIRVLRLANVAAFAAAGEVTSVELAVVRLGTRAVRHAVLAACFSAWAQTVQTHGPRGAVEIRHAVGTACLARRLAQLLRLQAEDAFVQGLLHDVGKLVLFKLRAEYLRLGGRAPSSDEFDATIQEKHPDVGATALQLWGIPDSIREPVRWHHEPLAAGQHAHASTLVYVANRLSHRYAFGRPPADDEDDLEADPVAAALGLGANWLAKLDEEALGVGMAAQHLVS